jgi:hypothetical protein
VEITEEMKKWFDKRTKEHIQRVYKYLSIFYNGEIPAISNKDHDASKFKEPEYTPYVIITWDYYCKKHKLPFTVPDDIKIQLNKATLHHIKSNIHHPEYWVERETELLSRDNRDDPNIPTIYIENMPLYALIEMCADWCAMSEEKDNTPFQWYDSVISTRWDFGDKINKRIYVILEKMWK